MTSTVDICNIALDMLGASTISSLDENSKTANLISKRYDSARDFVFREHVWNSLIRRAELSQETTKPPFGYDFQYQLPTDPFCLRVLEFSNGSLSYPQDNMMTHTGDPVFVIEGRKLLTNEDTAKIKYISRITDPNEYDAGLIETLAAYLATEICYAVTGSTSLMQVTYAKYEQTLRNARHTDATEGATTRLEASDFIESRF